MSVFSQSQNGADMWQVLDKVKGRKAAGKQAGKEGRIGWEDRREGRSSPTEEYLLQDRHGQSEQSSLYEARLHLLLLLSSCTLGCQSSCSWCSSASSFSRSDTHLYTAGLSPLEGRIHHIKQLGSLAQHQNRFCHLSNFAALCSPALFLYAHFLLLESPLENQCFPLLILRLLRSSSNEVFPNCSLERLCCSLRCVLIFKHLFSQLEWAFEGWANFKKNLFLKSFYFCVCMCVCESVYMCTRVCR